MRWRGEGMEISPDGIVIVSWAGVVLNATILFTWLVMILMSVGSWLMTRNLSCDPHASILQNLMEVIVLGIQQQIREIGQTRAQPFLPFIGTLFLFILVCNVLTIVPGYQPPTGSLSTTVALAISVAVAVPIYGIQRHGVRGYLSQYFKPTWIMFPFNIIGEISRIISLSVRLFGNVMSGSMTVGILISIAPLFFPIVMQAFGLLTGVIQAYIFVVLAMVYIGAAIQSDTDSDISSSNQSGVSPHG